MAAILKKEVRGKGRTKKDATSPKKDGASFKKLFATIMTICIMVPKKPLLDKDGNPILNSNGDQILESDDSINILTESFIGIKVGSNGVTIVKEGDTYECDQHVNHEYDNEEIFHNRLVIFPSCIKKDRFFQSERFDLYNVPIFCPREYANK